MGEVYLAEHPRLPRLEALKILPEEISAAPGFRQRFAREADMAASLFHPNIVAVHDRGEYDGQLWITMDYVDGTDAARLVRERYPRGMPVGEALEIVTAIADALDYAHERNLLHRDVKPANILITDGRVGQRRVMLADFGIAKIANDADGLTATNMTVGSVAYAAPEQLLGEPIDGRADQYALACTAYHLLTGRQPFVQTNPAAIIGSHLSGDRPRLSSLRPELAWMDLVLAKGMAREASGRFDSCREFALALTHGDAVWSMASAPTRFAPKPAELPIRQVPTAEPRRSGRAEVLSNPANRIAMIAIAVALVAVVGMIAYIAGGAGRPAQSEPGAVLPPTTAWDENLPSTAPRKTAETVTETATTTVTMPSMSQPPARSAPRSGRPPGDLGLATPIGQPLCNGQGIVVLGNVTTPGQYEQGVRRLLQLFPGASYLRTDQSCPSLRQADDEGDPIYAVYRPAGFTLASVCSAVRAAGGDAYGKWLDHVHPPSHQIRC
mgnify:CR=1 FL=1